MKHVVWFAGCLLVSAAGAKLFYLSGIRNGKYLQREVLNLARFISVMKFRPLSWRLTHPYLLTDRFEVLRTSRAFVLPRLLAQLGFTCSASVLLVLLMEIFLIDQAESWRSHYRMSPPVLTPHSGASAPVIERLQGCARPTMLQLHACLQPAIFCVLCRTSRLQRG